jgi:hypothetical protein
VLIKLARKWVERLYPIGKFIRDSFGFRSDWRVEYALYSSLLDAGCKPVGHYYRYVYMHCDNKLVVADISILFSRREGLRGQIKVLKHSEWEELIDRNPCVWLFLGALHVGVCGREPVEVVKLRIDYLYVKELNEVRVKQIYLGGLYDLYLHYARLSVASPTNSFEIILKPYGTTSRYINSIDYIQVEYNLWSSSDIDRKIYVRINSVDRVLRDKEVESSILETLNRRASIIDELIAQAEPLIYEPFKRLAIYVVY